MKQNVASQAAPSTIELASHETEATATVGPYATVSEEELFAGHEELPLAELVQEVLQRNPTLQAALSAWQAAAQRYPQVVALDDPMFQSMYAPSSFRSSSAVQSSYYLGVAQKIPWSGKRALRGEIADAEATALSLEFHDSELQLAEATRLAYFDYYLTHRELELNAENLRNMRDFRETARTRYESNLVTQQDVLQADVELAQLERRRLELERMNRVTIARINTLLHRIPDLPLPPPPKQLSIRSNIPETESLRITALENRPDLAAQASRIQAEHAAVALACKEYYPDFEFMGRYDSFWTDHEQRPQVGLNINIPLNHERRRAAVCEAMFKVSKMQAEYDQRVDNIRHDVQTAHARLEESRQTVQLYTEKILPAAQDNVTSARAEYIAGKLDFLRLIEAQRQLIELEEKRHGAVTDFHRRLAELERIVGTALSE